MDKRYNIHGLVGVRVNSVSKHISDGCAHYLRHFENGLQEISDLEIEDFEKFPPPKHNPYQEDFTKTERGICFTKEKYAISMEKGRMREYTTYANHATNLWIQAILVAKGFSFVHGAGVELGGKGIIFPALGGTGKTTLISALRDKSDFKFFGDDYVIIGTGGEMYSYPSDFSIYPFHIPLFNELENSQAAGYLRRRTIFAWYYKAKRIMNFIAKRIFRSYGPVFKGWNAAYAKVPVKELIPSEKIGQKTTLAASVFLERYEGKEMVFERMEAGILVDKIMGILNLESGDGIRYISAIASTGGFDIADFFSLQKKILLGAFSKLALYRLRIPVDISNDEYRAYLKENIANAIA